MTQKKLTLEEAQKILAKPDGLAPLRVAHATRMVNAAERAKQNPRDVAAADFAGKVNQIANGLCNGGRNHLLSMVSRFQARTVNHRATEEHPDGFTEDIPALISTEDMMKGVDYLQKCLDEVRSALEGSQDESGGGFKF